MKFKAILLVLFLSQSFLFAQINFEEYFLDKTMRFDYVLAGNASNFMIFYEKIKEEPYWGGSLKNLVDVFDFGDYRVRILDKNTEKLIYSRGFSNLFREWQDTDEAKYRKRSFYESIVFPYPKNEIILKIDYRNKRMIWNTVYSISINPNDYFIIEQSPPAYKTAKFVDSGDSHKKLDIVVIPDGYTKKEMKKFRKDANRFAKYFFKVAPFSENKDKVNFWLVEAVSEESGTDIPGKDIWKETVLNTHFYTFDSERYLTTQSIEKLRDIAACVPYDQIYILVNSDKYGGGGIYNYYNLCVSDHPDSEEVFTHEFGHAFAALADEYDYGYSRAEELYDLNVEPYQVNITTLADFDSKWKNMIEEGIPVPTPDNEKYRNKVGVYEGAGYVKKKVYRPWHDCKMRSNKNNQFCPVCQKALIEMLQFYSE